MKIIITLSVLLFIDLTTTAGETTTFSPPTVPVSLCNPSCNAANFPTEIEDPLCTCPERWVCKDKQCVCDDTIRCPTTLAICRDPINPLGCGCEEACDCTGTGADEECICKDDVTCPFPESVENCELNCNCTRNCNCTGEVGSRVCTCVNDGRQCPFDPVDCYLRCGCLTNCDRISFTPKAVCLEPCRCQDAYLCPFDKSECVAKCGCEKRCVITGTLARCDPDISC